MESAGSGKTAGSSTVISVKCVVMTTVVDHFVALVHDVTERKRAAEELAKRELYFRSLIEHSLDIVAVIAPAASCAMPAHRWSGSSGIRPRTFPG